MICSIFCDGGVVNVNPSPIGGTWAWVAVDGLVSLSKASGIITPKEMGLHTISNNLAELYAAVMALEATPEFAGTLYTDSKITMHRLLESTSFKGIPLPLRKRCVDLRRERKWTICLVAGHPTKEELAVGYSKRNDLPVSPWNVMVDRMCQEAARGLK